MTAIGCPFDLYFSDKSVKVVSYSADDSDVAFVLLFSGFEAPQLTQTTKSSNMHKTEIIFFTVFPPLRCLFRQFRSIHLS